jgi:hypothetical protein
VTEPNSALTFGDLILTVAERLGVAYYGVNGDEVAQVPTDAFTLDKCKRYVYDGIRMLMADAPPEGWRWQRPLASVVLWGDIAVDAAVTVTGVHALGLTTLTATAATFVPSMEGSTVTITGVGDFVIASYTSATVVVLTGDATCAGVTFSMTTDGRYALPQTFGGEVAGDITYAAGTDVGVPLNWCSELEIRRLRENDEGVTSNPYYAAVRRNQTNSRRWDLLVYPLPGGDYTVEFPYVVYFDKITGLTDVHPAGIAYDEVVKAASLAQAEMQGEDMLSGAMQYYRDVMLPNGYRIDGRQAPRRLGYCGNPRGVRTSLSNFRELYRRPTVTYGP